MRAVSSVHRSILHASEKRREELLLLFYAGYTRRRCGAVTQRNVTPFLCEDQECRPPSLPFFFLVSLVIDSSRIVS
jgi:hypothetical protein